MVSAVPYRITASAGSGGTITPSGEIFVDPGKSQALSIEPGVYYGISDVTVDGNSQGAVAAINLDNVVADHTIAASFALLDIVPPVITIYGVAQGGTYPACTTPSYSVTDALSGVASHSAMESGGDGNGLGTFTYTVTATDNAGNTATLSVMYTKVANSNLISFQSPVILGKPFQLGSTVPVKFVLTNDCGNVVPTAGATLALQYYSGDVPAEDPIVASSTVPDQGNRFRYSEGQYIYNLATDGLHTGRYFATATLDSGETRSVFISIKQ